MRYASYDYYTSRYLMDLEPSIPEDDFLRWEKQAECVIDQYTFNRLKTDSGLINSKVKDCTCELAELLYKADNVAQQAAEQGGFLESYSNDGESGSFDLSQSTYTEEGKAKKTKEIIYRYLGNTGLLYAGV